MQSTEQLSDRLPFGSLYVDAVRTFPYWRMGATVRTVNDPSECSVALYQQNAEECAKFVFRERQIILKIRKLKQDPNRGNSGREANPTFPHGGYLSFCKF